MHEWPRLHPTRLRRVQRLRRTGICVLAGCIALAILVYRIEVANHRPTMLELMPGTRPSIERQRGILFGRTGAAMMRWYDELQKPAGQAALVVILGIIGAAVFYQVAHRIEVEEG